MAAEEEKETRAAGSAFGARGPAIPAVAAVGTSGLLILTLWLGLSSRSAPVLLLGEPLPPPLLSPWLVLALVLVLLSPEPLLPRGKPPWRKKDCDPVAAGSGRTELDEDKTETERGWPRAGCIVLPEAASCTLPASPASGVLPGSGSSEIWTGVARTGPAWDGDQLIPPPQVATCREEGGGAKRKGRLASGKPGLDSRRGGSRRRDWRKHGWLHQLEEKGERELLGWEALWPGG